MVDVTGRIIEVLTKHVLTVHGLSSSAACLGCDALFEHVSGQASVANAQARHQMDVLVAERVLPRLEVEQTLGKPPFVEIYLHDVIWVRGYVLPTENGSLPSSGIRLG